MKTDTFKNYVIDQLSGMKGVRAKAMFGGFGLYRGKAFFACILKERLYYKTDERTSVKYMEAGMGPFRYNDRMTLKTYFEVPPDVIEDPDMLAEWAIEAAGIKGTIKK
jgi:DNA transformation protein